MMEAIILAGGLGTRLRPLISEVPKAMAPIDNKPFLEFILQNLSVEGFQKVVLSLGFMSDKVIGYFGSKFDNLEIVYSVENSQLGTGGATRLAIDRITSNETFVLNGDTYLELKYELVHQQWLRDQKTIIVGKYSLDVSRYGSLMTEGKLVTSLIEKGLSGRGIINAGCYLLSKKILESFPLNAPFSLEMDFLKPLIERGGVDAFIMHGKFIDIGIPQDYLRAQIELRSCKDEK